MLAISSINLILGKKTLLFLGVPVYDTAVSRFDGLALIHAVTDLAELLGRRTTVDEFLQDLVQTVASHLHADVCSVYLYDVEQDLLVLRATAGLNPALIGKVRLRPGEGLTGHAFLKNQPVQETDLEGSELNKTIRDLGEEEYLTFLGVPIKRGDLGIGVLTLQHRDESSLDDQALRALRALASHLAMTLESAAALYEAHEIPQEAATGAEVPRGPLFSSGLLNGVSASRGIAEGLLEYLEDQHDTDDSPVTRTLAEAVDLSYRQLQELETQVDQTLSDVAMMIFSAHLLMLRDGSFAGRMLALEQEGMDARRAVQQVVDDFSRRFQAIPDPRFQEKVQDVQDLGHRILRNLHSHDLEEGDYTGQVVVTHELFPSELVKLYLQNVEGLVFSGGSATSHVAILAQSLGVPVVATPDRLLFQIPTGTRIVVDAEDGKVVVGPAEEILEAYRARMSRTRELIDGASNYQLPPSLQTRDHVPVTLNANVNLVKDARLAAETGAAGIGLYRSEFPFLIRNGFPTEEEQLNVYRRVVEAMHRRPVSFRTLDLGGDKLLAFQVGREDNPFLGFRGVRFLLEHREILREQLRAMLRAGHDSEIGIQFPMVTSPDEFFLLRDEVRFCLQELEKDGLEHNSHPELGIMVELPSAIDLADVFAREVDFMSIGTNDLIMYLLAADRANHRVSALYRTAHPAVLRAIHRLVQAVRPYDVPLSVCGASAADPVMARFYLGVGITRLSVDISELPRMGQLISTISVAESRTLAARMLEAGTVADLARVIEAI